MNRCLGHVRSHIFQIKLVNVHPAHVKETDHLDMVFIDVLSQSRIKRQRVCTVSSDFPSKPFRVLQVNKNTTTAATCDRVGVSVD